MTENIIKLGFMIRILYDLIPIVIEIRVTNMPISENIDIILDEIEDLSKENSDVIFDIDDIDENGLVLIPVRHWLKYSDKIKLKIPDSKPWNREALYVAFGHQIIFV